MKKITLLLLIALTGCNKVEIQPDISFPMTNSINSYDYDIDIIRNSDEPTSIGIFVLDANDLLPLIHEELNNINVSESITLIGINTTENKRIRDYTPSTINSQESGQAGDFFKFIDGQLIPELISRELLDSMSRRALMGHSIGGLAGCYAFSNYNEVFTDYIILSPSLFWDDFKYFEIEKEQRANIEQNKSNIFIGIGQNEDLGITNGYDQFTEIIEAHYSNTILLQSKVKGSHFGSRPELINQALNFIIR